jgi:hypothetical protein
MFESILSLYNIDQSDYSVKSFGDGLINHSWKYPGYLFVPPIINNNKRNYVADVENNYYRLFPFVKDSYTSNEVQKPTIAYEAANLIRANNQSVLLKRFLEKEESLNVILNN